jgi:rhamnosyltransferase subunit B
MLKLWSNYGSLLTSYFTCGSELIMNVIILTQGTGGDLYPFIEIGSALTARGHKVTFIADPRFETVINSFRMDFAPLYLPDQIKKIDLIMSLERRFDRSLSVNQGHLSPSIMLDKFHICMGIYKNVKERSEKSDTILVSHHNLNIVGQTIAERLGAPYKLIFTAPYFVMQMSYLEAMYDDQSDIINQFRLCLGLPPVHDWKGWLKSHKCKLGLWPEWFTSAESEWMDNVFPVGFVWSNKYEVGEIPNDVREYVNSGDPPVLITHGTSEPDKPNFFSVAVEACKLLNRKVILVTADDRGLPRPGDNKLRTYEYLPFASLLPLVDTIIHHGGIGTLSRALAAGTPQLVLGYGYDRPDNGMRVQRLGVGRYLPPIRWQPTLVAEALRQIVTLDIEQRCKQFALRQIGMVNGADAACDIIQSC